MWHSLVVFGEEAFFEEQLRPALPHAERLGSAVRGDAYFRDESSVVKQVVRAALHLSEVRRGEGGERVRGGRGRAGGERVRGVRLGG